MQRWAGRLLFSLGLTIFSFLLIYTIYNRFFYSFGFTDEGDNISVGKYLLDGKKLYREIFSQHQPLAYYTSALVQKISHPDNLLLVVRRHRQFVLVFSFFWIFFIIARFGIKLLPFLLFLEIIKYYFLGHLYLSESLVIYPLLYLFFLLWKRGNFGKIEVIFASLCAFFLIFNLLPLLPAVTLLLTGIVLRQKRERVKVLFYLLFPLTIVTIILFLFVPLSSYLEGTLFTNFFYYLPTTTKHAVNIYQSPIRSFLYAAFYPFIVFTLPFKTFFILYRLVAIQLMMTMILLILSKKYGKAIYFFLLLAITNLRPAGGNHDFYQAFHTLPYFSLIIGFLGINFYPLLSSLKRNWQRIVYVLPVLISAAILIFDRSIYFREKIKEENLSYINFAEIYTFSDTIKKLSRTGDTLAVMPFEELLYWYPDLAPATRFLFYDEIVNEVPKFTAEIKASFSQNPPTFVYRPLYYLEPFLNTDEYLSLPRNTATYSGLYIRKDKADSITIAQWESIKMHGFIKP